MKEQIISFTIMGEPFGKLNMQPMIIGGHARAFQPKRNTEYMFKAQSSYREQCNPATDRNDNPDAQICIEIVAYYSIPKNTPKYKIPLIESGKIRPVKKPDCDNISKVICDSLSGIVFHDDAQIVDLKVSKYFSRVPRVEVYIMIRELEKGVDL